MFGTTPICATFTPGIPGKIFSPPTYPDPNNPDHLLARSEFERRSVYTSHLERSLVGGREHRLFGVVRECLANNPERRPTTSNLLSSLEEVGTEAEGGFLQQDIARVKTARSLRAKDRRIQELQVRSGKLWIAHQTHPLRYHCLFSERGEGEGQPSDTERQSSC